jgi:quercetin dioxygenase-like cupin family protein
MSKYFPEQGQLGRHTIFPNVTASTMAAERMLLAVVDLEANSVVTPHSHPHEQIGVIISGKVIFTIGDEEKTLGPGELYRIPGGVVHQVVALEKSQAVDIFCPVREEYR